MRALDRHITIDPSALTAFDVHVHLELEQSTEADAAARKYFGSSGVPRDAKGLADYYRSRRMAFVVFTVDERLTGRPHLSNDEIVQFAVDNADVALAFVSIDPTRGVVVLTIMLVAPVTAGMFIRAKHPATADRIRRPVRRLAGIVFAVIVAILLLGNVSVLASFVPSALPPVLVTFAVAAALGWGLSRASGLTAANRRAVTLEVAFQNVALAIGLAVAFFPELAGVAITSILWGVVHLTIGFAIAAMWMRMPIADDPAAASRSLPSSYPRASRTPAPRT